VFDLPELSKVQQTSESPEGPKDESHQQAEPSEAREAIRALLEGENGIRQGYFCLVHFLIPGEEILIKYFKNKAKISTTFYCKFTQKKIVFESQF